jgi:hypothetical protein
MKKVRPLTYWQSRYCADCRVDVGKIGEWYMVKDDIFEQAWPEYSAVPYGHAILCVGCLERRLGRTLTRHDFTDALVNDIFGDYKDFSDRLLNRLVAPMFKPVLPKTP